MLKRFLIGLVSRLSGCCLVSANFQDGSARNSLASFHRQKGVVLPLLAIGMLAIIGMVGLAMDTGHMHLNKGRLQSALDAAALSGARTLMMTKSTTDSSTHARDAFRAHLESEMADLDVNALVIRYATVLGGPYSAGSVDSKFIRVGFASFETEFTFASVLPGVGSVAQIGATALAGPIPVGKGVGSQICDVAPLLMCGDSLGDTDCSDVDVNGVAECYGLEVGAEVEYQLKTSDNSGNGNGGSQKANANGSGNGNGNGGSGNGSGNGSGGDPGPDPSADDISCSQGCFAPDCLPSSEVDEFGLPVDEGVGPGNFQIASVPGCNGANCVSHALAGASSMCSTSAGTVDTQPGKLVGPVIKGLSTRFGEYYPPMSASVYPPDAVTTNRCSALEGPDYWYEDYLADSAGDQPAGTLPDRRVLTIPIIDCDGIQTGKSTLDVLSYGCFFLTRNMPIQGGLDSYIYGQFIGECEASGTTGENPDPVNEFYGPWEIVLYNDPAPES